MFGLTVDPVTPIAGLLQTLIAEAENEKRRRHEQQVRELEIISDSKMRDSFAQQLLLDKFLFPIEKAQHDLANAAKHAQSLAESFHYYYQDHSATAEQERDISAQLRYLAVQLTEANSLHDLKILYAAATHFTIEISHFKHHDRKYSLERSIRKSILDVLNTCIAVGTNFQRRIELMTPVEASSSNMLNPERNAET
ncbi:MAG: hypothetical protein AAF329_12110 [Cyanobacteria bacterium P01_A01_bin.17]